MAQIHILPHTPPLTPPHIVDKNFIVPVLSIDIHENDKIKDISFTSNQSTTVKIEENANVVDSATKIGKAWRHHRIRREKLGKVISAESREKIYNDGNGCLHLPSDSDSDTCPVWLKWEELLDNVEAQMQRKNASKIDFAVYVVERIGRGSGRVKNHLWLILDTEHWLEICDENHRYGANLKVYHDYWLKTSTRENFFYWLDKGEGKTIDLKARSRDQLERDRVKYLSKAERAEHEVIFKDGLLIYKKSGLPVHTDSIKNGTLNSTIDLLSRDSRDPSPTPMHTLNSTIDLPSRDSRDPSPTPSHYSVNDNAEEDGKFPSRRSSLGRREKWIYVTDCYGNFYVGQKTKGHFHHSSFLAGGAIAAAGGIKVRNGKLIELNPKSGHYKPGQHHFKALVDRLQEENVDLSEAHLVFPNEIIEKHLIAKYKIKRLAILTMVYDEIMQDASNKFNRQIDSVDRHVTKLSSTIKRNVRSFLHEGKEALREWYFRNHNYFSYEEEANGSLHSRNDEDSNNDHKETWALDANDGELSEDKTECNTIETVRSQNSKVYQKRKSLGFFDEFRRSISSISSLLFGIETDDEQISNGDIMIQADAPKQDNKTDNNSITENRRASLIGNENRHSFSLFNFKFGFGPKNSKDHDENL